MCSPSLPSGILDKTGVCIRISSKAESLIWRAEVLSCLLVCHLYVGLIVISSEMVFMNFTAPTEAFLPE
jgi:hypothetical protein